LGKRSWGKKGGGETRAGGGEGAILGVRKKEGSKIWAEKMGKGGENG